MPSFVTGKLRSELTARSHQLKPMMTLNPGEVADAIAEHIRRLFDRDDLIKLRVQSEDGTECDKVAYSLSDQVPCAIVRRVGRVLLLYRPKSREEAVDTEPDLSSSPETHRH